MDKQELNLDSTLLLPIKKSLENIIKKLMYSVINEDKEAEITLKISLDKINREIVDKNTFEVEKYIEPIISYQITEKIKAYKETSKGVVGFDFRIDQEKDKFVIEEVNKQLDMFEKEEK